MNEKGERRAAERVRLPQPIEGHLGVTPVRIVELSLAGARLEHEERATVNARAKLKFKAEGESLAIDSRVARSSLAGRRGDVLMYETGVQFENITNEATRAVAILCGEAPPPAPAPEPAPASEPEPAPEPEPQESFSVFSKDNPFGASSDDDEEFSFIRCELTESGWRREYVNSPEQPQEGFTVSAAQRLEVDGLQKTYEVADPETRSMMRIACAAQLR